MNFDEYQDLSERTMNKDLYSTQALTMSCLGLAGETGETIDLIKKFLYHGHPLDKEKLTLELGDVLFYLAAIARVQGIRLQDVAEKNVAKLKARYPEGFTSEASLNRTEK